MSQKELSKVVKCLICGKQFKQITHTHLFSAHNMKMETYLKKYNLKKQDLSSQLTKKISTVTLENMIRIYGQQQGTKRFDQYRRKQAYTNSLQYKKEKYGWSQQDFKKYNKSRAVTLDLCIKRHGIQKGTKIFQDYCQKQSYAGTKLQYFQQKYGIEKGTLIYQQVCKNKAITLDNMVRVYGEQGGKNAFENWLNNRRASRQSNIALQLFNALISQFKQSKTNRFMFFGHGEQLHLGSYFIDFYDSKTKKAIEFNGTYWHADPSEYDAKEVMNFPGKRALLAQQVWKKDQQRINELLKYDKIKDILIIWQKQYRNFPQETIQKCIQFLSS